MSLLRHVLYVGPNDEVRATRQEMLQRAGYVVRSFQSTPQALRAISSGRAAFDIVVVCDCAAAVERARLIATVKAASPHVPVLVIGDRRDPLADGVVNELDGPQALLDHVSALLV